MRESNARSLGCGLLKRFHGWCSGHKRAKKERERFLTVLVNPKEDKRQILGQTVTKFAAAHHLCKNEVYKLINRRKVAYRGWMLESTYLQAQNAITGTIF